MRRISFLITLAIAATLGLAPGASAQVEIYASDYLGNPADFVLGAQNTVSLRGTVDPATGGETLKVRQIAATDECPTALGTTVNVDFTFTAWVPAGDPVNVPNATNGIFSGRRDAKLCIYAYYQDNPLGEAFPNKTYEQLIHFRDPMGASDWLFVGSADSPDLPFFGMTGTNEAHSGEAIAVVSQAAQCPASYPGGEGAMVFPGSPTLKFSHHGEISIGVGFWRACGYIVAGEGSYLVGQSAFSRAPVGGWKPAYKLAKGKVKVKSGKIALGTATCSIACNLSIVATAGGKTLATGKASGAGKLKLKLKTTSAGKKAARRHVKAKFTVTSLIDTSETTKTVSLKLR